jgi:hypothetical protein
MSRFLEKYWSLLVWVAVSLFAAGSAYSDLKGETRLLQEKIEAKQEQLDRIEQHVLSIEEFLRGRK